MKDSQVGRELINVGRHVSNRTALVPRGYQMRNDAPGLHTKILRSMDKDKCNALIAYQVFMWYQGCSCGARPRVRWVSSQPANGNAAALPRTRSVTGVVRVFGTEMELRNKKNI